MKFLRLLLFPLSWLYAAVTQARNFLYDRGVLRSLRFDVAVISVGNITIGGTGKTPTVEMLIGILGKHWHTAVLSRGYRRRTKGFRLAKEQDDAHSIGDEPYQYYLKFGDRVRVAVGEDRALAIPELLRRCPDTDLIIMDDAFQHRSVSRNIDILLMDYYRPFYRDHVLPAGLLREKRTNARRADLVVVTKCPPDMSDLQQRHIESRLAPLLRRDCPVFFSSIEYLPLRPVFGSGTSPGSVERVVFMSGIAHDQPALEYLRSQYSLEQVISFPDHYRYSNSVLRRKVLRPIRNMQDDGVFLVTTEKDRVRIVSLPESRTLFTGIPFYYLPIRFKMLGKEKLFDALLRSKIDRRILVN